MLDPCIGCAVCPFTQRKADCLAMFPNLRTIGNSPGGFKAAVSSAGWTFAEVSFYNSQINLIYGRHQMPDVL